MDAPPDYTILFTAFDSEEEGSFGSQEFLNKIIVPHFIRQGVNIQVRTFMVIWVVEFPSEGYKIRKIFD